MSPSSRVALAVVALLLLSVSPATAAHAAHARHHRPNLVVSALDLTVAGRAINGTVTVRNIGNAAAARTVTSVGGQLIATPGLRAGRRARLVVATTLPAGATQLLLCVDVRHRIREQSEADNCQTYTVPTTTTSTSTPSAPPPSNPGVHASTGPVAN